MDTRLTVRVNRRLLENAKRYARENNTTLTALISAYLKKITAEGSELEGAPIVRRLSGSLSSTISFQEYKNHLDEKYDG